jgi:hypothetical protein
MGSYKMAQYFNRNQYDASELWRSRGRKLTDVPELLKSEGAEVGKPKEFVVLNGPGLEAAGHENPTVLKRKALACASMQSCVTCFASMPGRCMLHMVRCGI